MAAVIPSVHELPEIWHSLDGSGAWEHQEEWGRLRDELFAKGMSWEDAHDILMGAHATDLEDVMGVMRGWSLIPR
jgi:hypothetical protein